MALQSSISFDVEHFYFIYYILLTQSFDSDYARTKYVLGKTPNLHLN